MSVTAHSLEYTDSSPRAFLVRMGRAHPPAVAGNVVLDRVGRRDTLDARVLDLLQDINEDAAAFRASAEYVIASMRHE